MMKTYYTKEEIKDMLLQAKNSNQLFQELADIIIFLEAKFTNIFINQIKERQKKLKKLWVDDTGYLSIWNGTVNDLSKGCQSCLDGKINHIRSSNKCSQNCTFCYYYQDARKNPILSKLHYNIAGGTLTKEEIKLCFERQITNNSTKAIGWLQKEPLSEIDKIPDIMNFISKKGFHQYLYTNGIYANEENLKILSDNGLNEIRFNLQATNFSDKVLNHMKIAREYFDTLCIETPMFSDTLENYRNKKNQILDTGVDQINSPELQLNHTNYHLYGKEGMLYRHRKGYISPVSSRQYTYDLIEMAEKENWNVVINDCSNDTKFYRGAKPTFDFGIVEYDTFGLLPVVSYLYMLNLFEEDVFEVF